MKLNLGRDSEARFSQYLEFQVKHDNDDDNDNEADADDDNDKIQMRT